MSHIFSINIVISSLVLDGDSTLVSSLSRYSVNISNWFKMIGCMIVDFRVIVSKIHYSRYWSCMSSTPFKRIRHAPCIIDSITKLFSPLYIMLDNFKFSVSRNMVLLYFPGCSKINDRILPISENIRCRNSVEILTYREGVIICTATLNISVGSTPICINLRFTKFNV